MTTKMEKMNKTTVQMMKMGMKLQKTMTEPKNRMKMMNMMKMMTSTN